MAVKRVYLIRHGESVGNRDRIHQNAQTPLSEIGHSQAKLLAHRFKHIAIDQLFASPYLRAQQTAGYISRTTKKPVVTNADIYEWRKPSVLQGLKVGTPFASQVITAMQQNSDDPNYHYSDEENYFDLIERAQKVLKSLDSIEGTTALVSHGTFLRTCVCVLLYPEATPSILRSTWDKIWLDNTGISIIEFRETWIVRTLNDLSHIT